MAVFCELFKKTQEIKRQAQLLHEKNLELENAKLTRLNMLIRLGQELAAKHEPARSWKSFVVRRGRLSALRKQQFACSTADGRSPAYFFQCGATDNCSESDAPSVSSKALEALITERRPLRLNEFDELLRDHDRRDPAALLFGSADSFRRRVFGWVYLLNKTDAEDFSEADERLAATLATQVAISYENAKLYHDAQLHAEALQLEMAERKQAEEGKSTAAGFGTGRT